MISGHNFGLIGAAAYVAPRHLKAISETGNVCVAALDPHDAVGILDSFAPDCRFFTQFERFDRHVNKLTRSGSGLDWLSICSPNWLHDSHCLSGLRYGANVICEKPLVLSPWNLDELEAAEAEADGRIYTVMQLRFHEAIERLKTEILPGAHYEVDLTYVTGRGPWYETSWKYDELKSGGLIFNIGVHFLDALIWLFGPPRQSVVFHRSAKKAAGFFDLHSDKCSANVTWFLSIDPGDVPVGQTGPTFRSMTINGEEIEFTKGFADLHTEVYRRTLAGGGVTVASARNAIELAHRIRTAKIK